MRSFHFINYGLEKDSKSDWDIDKKLALVGGAGALVALGSLYPKLKPLIKKYRKNEISTNEFKKEMKEEGFLYKHGKWIAIGGVAATVAGGGKKLHTFLKNKDKSLITLMSKSSDVLSGEYLKRSDALLSSLGGKKGHIEELIKEKVQEGRLKPISHNELSKLPPDSKILAVHEIHDTEETILHINKNDHDKYLNLLKDHTPSARLYLILPKVKTKAHPGLNIGVPAAAPLKTPMKRRGRNHE